MLVALEKNCSDENFAFIRLFVFLNLFENFQFTGNKPVTWKDLLTSWILIRWNTKTPHISLNWPSFVFAIAVLFTSSRCTSLLREGAQYFVQSYVFATAKRLPMLMSGELPTLIIWAMSCKDGFPRLRRRKASIRFLAVFGPFYIEIF